MRTVLFPALLMIWLLAVWPQNLRADGQERIALQLKWSHSFQFAGYYTALEKGYYREAGLEVRMLEGRPGLDTAAAVLAGEAQYGVGTTGLLLLRNQGKPVVVLAVIFQHSPLVLLARRTEEMQSIHDLAGKRIRLEPQSDELLAYLSMEGLRDKVRLLENGHDLNQLLDHTVDAVSAYLTVEPYLLDRLDFPYTVFSPRSAGIDFYGDNLFTTQQEVLQHADRVKAFRAASLRGWQYAMAHHEEIADLILAKYPTPHHRDFLLNEARRMHALMQPDLIEVGYMHEGRWRHIVETYQELGMLPQTISLKGFLYVPEQSIDPTLLIKWAAVVVAALVLAGWLLVRFSRIARQARESEERHRLLADHATDVIWTMDLHGRFTYVSPSVEKLRGYTPQEVMRQTLREALAPESARIAREKLIELARAVKTGGELPSFRGEMEQLRKDGSTVWTEVSTSPIRNADNVFIGLLGVTRDISKRKRMEEELRSLATTDPLTGAYNRRFLYERTRGELVRSRRFNEPLTFLLVDIDWFKTINDSYGHDAGDQVLRILSATGLKLIRSSDLFCRLGGEEFGILLVNTDGQGGRVFAEKLREKLASLEVESSSGTIRFTVSIGAAEAAGDIRTVDDLIKQADLALYRAKAGGRNRVELAADPNSRQATVHPHVSMLVRLTWDESMNSGHPKIDFQHRHLFSAANQLLNAGWQEGDTPLDPARVEQFLADVAAHFADEENILRNTGYAELDQHMELHRSLLARAERLLEKFRTGKAAAGDLFQFIIPELVYGHLVREDPQYYPHIKAQEERGRQNPGQ